MDRFRIAVFFCVLTLTSAADAQAPQRVRGTIIAFDGNVFSVKSPEGRNVNIQLAEKTVIVFTQPIALADIKPGDFLGVTSMKRADGALTAFEVRRFPKPVNPGHRPFEGRDDQTMTNATVSAMSSGQGRGGPRYEGGSQKIWCPKTRRSRCSFPATARNWCPARPRISRLRPAPTAR
jgi:hypothetical protein